MSTSQYSLCFDIYRAAGGGYWKRVVTMPIAWGIILVLSMMNTFTLLRQDRKLWSRDTLRGLRYLFGRRGLVTGLVPAFFEYLSPRWNPWKQDNSQEIARWEQANQSYVQKPKDRALAAS